MKSGMYEERPYITPMRHLKPPDSLKETAGYYDTWPGKPSTINTFVSFAVDLLWLLVFKLSNRKTEIHVKRWRPNRIRR